MDHFSLAAQSNAAIFYGLQFSPVGRHMQRRYCSFLAAAKGVIAVIGLTLALAGCSTPWDPETDDNVVACRSIYGFARGSREFDQCMQKFKEIDSRKANRSLL
jgi:hypothetical protein